MVTVTTIVCCESEVDMNVAVREAKMKFSEYGDLAHNGQTIVVCKNGKPWFDITPHKRAARKITPLIEFEKTICEEEATKPLSNEDLSGWM